MAKVQEVVQRVYDNGYVYEGLYEGWYCPRCADFKTESELGPGQHLPDPRDPARCARASRTGSSGSAPSRSSSSASTRSARTSSQPRLSPQRGALVHQGRAPGRLALAAEADLGRAGAVGPETGDLRLVGRAPQLLHGALLRARGRGPDRALLARRPARDRQGHPQVPRRLLAGVPARGRDRAAAARLRPRLPADGREEDVEVARQRARPVRGDRALRRRRAALLLLARGLLRPGRQRLRRRLRVPLRDRARQRLGQPRLADAGDDRALPRRGRPRGREPTRRCATATTRSRASTASSASCSTGSS